MVHFDCVLYPWMEGGGRVGTTGSEFIIYQEVARFCQSYYLTPGKSIFFSVTQFTTRFFETNKQTNKKTKNQKTTVLLFDGLNKNLDKRSYKNPMYEQELQMYEYK